MKTYRVHYAYIGAIGIFLLITGHTTIKEFIDPTYYVFSSRYIPRALFWYLIAFCWYKFLTTAYKVEINENGTIKTISLLKKHLLSKGDIVQIEDGTFYFTVSTKRGNISVSPLIDGITNIKQVFSSHQTIDEKCIVEDSFFNGPLTKKKLLKIGVFILLTVYAIYVEYMQWTVYRP